MDTAYIALVNPVHFAYAREALLAGKNVILEKPFCTRWAQTRELADLARGKGLFLLEAMPLWHGALFRKIRELVPALGPIRLVQGNYSQYSSRYDRYRKGEVLPAFDPALAGGALYDLNVYNIAWTAGLWGLPEKVLYAPNRGWNAWIPPECCSWDTPGSRQPSPPPKIPTAPPGSWSREKKAG